MIRVALVGLALLAVTAPAAGAAVPVPRTSWVAVDRAPFRLAFSSGPSPLLAQRTGGSLEYTTGGGVLHRLTSLTATTGTPGVRSVYTVATDEPGRTATVTVAATEAGAHVDVTLTPASGVAEVREAFAGSPAEHFLGGGERPGYVDLRGQAPSLAVSVNCAPAPAPFFLSTAGYGVFVHGNARGRFAFPAVPDVAPRGCAARDDFAACAIAPAAGQTQLCSQASSLSYDVYAGAPAAVMRAYTAAAGRTRVPPPSQFALIKWRDEVRGPGEVMDDIGQLQSRGIPIGWVLLDNPWEAECIGRLVFDRSRIPDPAGLIRDVHAKGVRFMLWVSPMATCPESYPQSQLTGNPATGAYTQVDLTKADAVAEFQRRLRGVLALGVDGVKGDRADEIDVGAPQNVYPVAFAQAVNAVLGERTPTFAEIFRAGWTGSQSALRGLWAGDQEGSFAGLAAAVRMAATAGVSGYPIWGSDTGGYQSTALTPEVFVRWAQLSAVSPVFEVGGRGPNATFWQFGDETTGLFRDAAILHYELFPYLYALAQAAAATGEPILRPLGYQFPRDAASWGTDLSLIHI